MKNIVVLGSIVPVACGTEKKDSLMEEGCIEKGKEGEKINICTFRFPIQETGFQCPEGTPYLFEFEDGAVWSQNPGLSFV